MPYRHPDFATLGLVDAPECRFAPAHGLPPRVGPGGRPARGEGIPTGQSGGACRRRHQGIRLRGRDRRYARRNLRVHGVGSGIMHALTVANIPYVLAGSIRDDGPLPETIVDALEAQAAMREQTTKATMVVMVASALHSIAAGNMLPDLLRCAGRRDPGDHDDLRRPDRVSGVEAERPGHAQSLRRRHQRPGFHAPAATRARSSGIGTPEKGTLPFSGRS